MLDTSLEIVIPLPNGGSLRCGPGANHEHGGQVRTMSTAATSESAMLRESKSSTGTKPNGPNSRS
jgi:hypothetical protein